MLSVTAQDLGVYEADWDGVSINGTYYFQGKADATGGDFELWKSDGTPQGTVRVKDIYPGSIGSEPQNFTNLNGTLYFTARDYTGYIALFKSDGTAGGTTVVHTFVDLPDYPFWFCAAGNLLFFRGSDSQHGEELWVSDGTDAGTHMVRDLAPGTQGTSLGDIYAFGNKVFFQGWGYDSTGTYVGIEPYVSDGTYAGTHLLKDIYPGTSNGYPVYWQQAGGKLYFSAQTPANGVELWVTDGTEVGTQLVKDILPGAADSNVHPVIEYKGMLYSITNPDNANQQLWKTDPATGTTSLVKNPIGKTYSPAFNFDVVNGRMLFIGHDSTRGDELWVSDGTTSGTHNLSDINPGAADGTSNPVITAGGWGFFIGNDGVHGTELWASDGATSAGTFMVADAVPGSANADPVRMRAAGNKLFYGVLSNLTPSPYVRRLWVATATAPPPPPPPPAGGSIAGTVFTDANGNGVRDAGEAGLAGITVWNDADNDKVLDASEIRTTTDASGNYLFSNLPAGSYKIRQVLQGGWVQTTPANGYGWTLTLGSGQSLTGKNFGTRQTSTGASISGVVFNDLDGDAVRDSNEPGLSGRTVWIDLNNDKLVDPNEKSTTTDASGNYKLSGLAAGIYKVRQLLPVGWSQTTPANGYGIGVTVTANQSVSGKNFGARQVTGGARISGTVFGDLNSNGIRDAGETALSGRVVFIDLDNDKILDSNELYTTTDAMGNFTLSGLAAGTYKVRQVVPTGWAQTTPANGYGINVTVSANQSVSGKLFGLRESA